MKLRNDKMFSLTWFKIILLGYFSLSLQPTLLSGDEGTENDESYSILVEKCLSGEAVSFFDLRMKYGDTEYYNVYGSAISKELKTLNEQEEFISAVELIKENVRNHLGELQFIYHAIPALVATEDEKLDFFRYVFWGLFDSISHSGDGLTSSTAYPVISTNEEYIFMGMNNIDYVSQSLQEYDGHMFDVFEVHPSEAFNGELIYFNIDKIFEEYDQVF